MQNTETKKRIEYRANLQVVRDLEMAMLRQVKEGTVAAKTPVSEAKQTRQIIECKSYIKCKNHDFF